MPALLDEERNRLPIYLEPTEFADKHTTYGVRQQQRSGVTNVISFSSGPLDVDLQVETPQPQNQETNLPDSLALPALKVIAVEVINQLPALILVINDSIYHANAVSETTLESHQLGLTVDIPQGAKRHDYEGIIRKQVEAQGYSISRFLLIRSFFFDSGKTWVRNDASAQLDKIIEVMVVHPEMDLQMTFHSDSRGTDAFNLGLSKARAEEVVQYLGKAGIKRTRIFSRFVGESQPLNDCGDLADCDELVHQINRTAEFKFIVR
jgi:outer membrane protein OmpA-like peptidoglycan-associated protein